ncbi:hypothetical protein C8R46DRAFT_552997 [Mycena filopes]|nr:hypothetical protein C8R46DRAFT_552997 [Mycena filopes]
MRVDRLRRHPTYLVPKSNPRFLGHLFLLLSWMLQSALSCPFFTHNSSVNVVWSEHLPLSPAFHSRGESRHNSFALPDYDSYFENCDCDGVEDSKSDNFGYRTQSCDRL